MKTVILDDWEHATASSAVDLERLKQFSDVVIYHDQPTAEELQARLVDADAVIFMRERTKITKELLDGLKQIKLIAQTGTGIAHVDLAEVNKRKIPLATTPGGSTAAVTELTFALLLAFSRDLTQLSGQMKQGKWPVHIGTNVEKKTIGLIGLGKIGCAVAQVAKALGMRVIAYGPRLTKERAEAQGVEWVTLDELLVQSHFVSLHVRLVPETKQMLGKEHFAKMRPDAVLINTARGELVDEAALVDALQHHQIRGAGLDVFVQEPLDPKHPLLQLDNVVLSPHIGWKTDDTFASFLNGSIENIESYFRRGQPIHIKNPEVLL